MVLQGDLIKLASGLKKAKREKVAKLEEQFHMAFKSFKQSSSEVTLGALQLTRTKLDLALTELADKHLRHTQYQFFLKSNKSDSMLARRLRSSDLSTKPITLKVGIEAYTTNLVKIVKTFRRHLETLYSAPGTFDKDKAESLFSTLTLPSMPPPFEIYLKVPSPRMKLQQSLNALSHTKSRMASQHASIRSL